LIITNKGFFIAGTGTDVGKTYIGCVLSAFLYQQGITVAPFKPIESNCLIIDNKLHANDANMYFKAIDKSITDAIIAPYRFKQICSTARAAKLNQKKITLFDIVEHININKIFRNNSILIVEGAGGMLSPLCYDGFNIDLAKKLGLPIILVASNKLGVINDILLNLKLFDSYDLDCQYIILNDTDNDTVANDDMNNLNELKEYTKIKIVQNDYNSHSFLQQIKIPS